jgi:hypothetical protein
LAWNTASVGDVERDGEEAVAVTGQRPGYVFRLPGGCHDSGAAVKGLPGDLLAEAAGRSRHVPQHLRDQVPRDRWPAPLGRHWAGADPVPGSMFVDGFGSSELGWGGVYSGGISL